MSDPLSKPAFGFGGSGPWLSADLPRLCLDFSILHWHWSRKVLAFRRKVHANLFIKPATGVQTNRIASPDRVNFTEPARDWSGWVRTGRAIHLGRFSSQTVDSRTILDQIECFGRILVSHDLDMAGPWLQHWHSILAIKIGIQHWHTTLTSELRRTGSPRLIAVKFTLIRRSVAPLAHVGK